jgi:hypothetical protein
MWVPEQTGSVHEMYRLRSDVAGPWDSTVVLHRLFDYSQERAITWSLPASMITPKQQLSCRDWESDVWPEG